MDYVVLGCRCMIGLVFLASVVSKLRGRESYARFVAATARLGPGWIVARVPAGVLAGGVIAAEAAVLVLLVLPGTAWVGFVLAGLLALVFAVAVLAALRRGDRAPCHCFGASTRPVGGVHLVRNVVLGASAGLGLTVGAAAAGPLEPAGVVAAVVAGAVAAALVVTADDVAELFRSVVPLNGHHATKGSL
ncbi:DoxX family protein [Flindersiella endophytica]